MTALYVLLADTHLFTMPPRLISTLIVVAIVFLLDYYFFQGIRTAFASKKTLFILYWALTAVFVVGFSWVRLSGIGGPPSTIAMFISTFFFILYIGKLFGVVVLLFEDIYRIASYGINYLAPQKTEAVGGEMISRKQFLSYVSLGAAAIPVLTMSSGLFNAYNYKVRNVKLRLPNLPDSFEGFKIVQLSDIHSGSLYNKEAVEKGIDLVLAQKPDTIFFTGDIVNDKASELEPFTSIYGKLKAPYGVFSVLGNHDYGDYTKWPSQQAKDENVARLKYLQREMGWDLLMDENRTLTKNGESIGVIGIQNWGGRGNFPKYGDLAKAYQGIENQAVKLLLSHDPSHWDAQVRSEYPDIDVMFSGHTHGMQFGVEIPGLKWSPVKYLYKQWAGLYQEGKQQLYVNRGFGFIGYPGRVGIMPEITVFELSKS